LTRIYFDNAATTPLDPDVLEAMLPFLTEKFGNPSSIYSYGRESKMAIEQSRKSVARLLNANPGEIFFNSGGTEGSNTAIIMAVRDLGCKRIITSPIEHHATLHATTFLHESSKIRLEEVRLLENGHVDLADLEQLLENSSDKTLVTLMHANNEIGNLLDITAVAGLCRKYDAIFHCDTVQTVGHYPIDLKKLPVHFITAAAHKFHGPKGSGMLYVNEAIKVKPLIHGGGQERNLRAGTENVYGIVGFAKALENAVSHMESNANYIGGLRKYMAGSLRENIPGLRFNGDQNGLYTVLSVSIPRTDRSEMILMNLDMKGICVSGGSACTSGAATGSHVIRALYPGEDPVAIRFSFSKYNTLAEVGEVVCQIAAVI
jgi:cysteine desulfurase